MRQILPETTLAITNWLRYSRAFVLFGAQSMYCPQCGKQSFTPQNDKSLSCYQCGFVYFHNTASAVLAVITYQDEILIAIRGQNPGKGMYDFPGGFVDHDESLEQALSRELQEELGYEQAHGKYLGSHPNTYHYKDVTYKTCDSFFHLNLKSKPAFKAADDVEKVLWLKTKDVNSEYFAFESAKQALALLR
ncbi:NUDIX domain-containing protein [Photobacterium makurazakiensis]|uniref:NUDIX hydrolase n=1 Tax=Photobacterium makurazakiensis TaxID=2910234 RepID=UPI003D0B6B42